MSRGRTRRNLVTACGALLAITLLVALLHRPMLRRAGGLLVVEDAAPAGADLILLLNGGVYTRPFRAAELYGEGRAPRIVIAQSERLSTERLGLAPNTTDISVGVLRRLGVPDSAVTVLPFGDGTTSTRDEARALGTYLRSQSSRRVIVVTSDYHTRRARGLLRAELAGVPVELRMVPAREAFSPSDWWESEAGFLAYVEEFLKISHSRLVGG